MNSVQHGWSFNLLSLSNDAKGYIAMSLLIQLDKTTFSAVLYNMCKRRQNKRTIHWQYIKSFCVTLYVYIWFILLIFLTTYYVRSVHLKFQPLIFFFSANICWVSMTFALYCLACFMLFWVFVFVWAILLHLTISTLFFFNISSINNYYVYHNWTVIKVGSYD